MRKIIANLARRADGYIPGAGVGAERLDRPRSAGDDGMARFDQWPVGGADLFAAFLDAGQLNELVVHIVRTLIGAGMPLFKPRHRSFHLRLLGCRRFADGVVRLQHAVPR